MADASVKDRLPVFKFGGQVRMLVASYDAWVARQGEVKPAACAR